MLQGSAEVKQTISYLQYGSIGVNAWTGMAYIVMPLTWGAFPGESLENVESGIGQVKNVYFVPHVQKSVLRTPLINGLQEMEHDLGQATREVEATVRFLLNPGIGTFVRLLAAAMGFHLPSFLYCIGRGQHKGESLLGYWIVAILGITAIVLYLNGARVET